jgi:hypothetical protein
MNPFLFQLAIIFIPGMLWERIDAMVVQKLKLDQFDVIRRSFVFGIISYLSTYYIYRWAGYDFIFTDLLNEKSVLSSNHFSEILAATIVSAFLSIIYVSLASRKYHYLFFQFIRATKGFGPEDVWDFALNSRDERVGYAHLRDFNKRIIYAGYIDKFSATEKIRELMFRDVILYDFDGNKILESPRMYIARAMDDIDLEFPYNPKK